ncbi:MAG: hypothetical protein JNL90_00460 [Planctomycetes bacterium]|nr:hypothetical protein [Planctomycetota bacterium]
MAAFGSKGVLRRGVPLAIAIGWVSAGRASGQEETVELLDEGPAQFSQPEITEFTRGITYGIAESSWIHQPQIEDVVATPSPRVIPIIKLPIDPVDRANFRPAPRRFAGFDGIANTGWVPPDPCLAVGPNHVVQTVNMKIAWYDKAGTQQFSADLGNAGNPGFFEGVGAQGFTFDPKCFYDEIAGRFVVVVFEVYGTTESWIDIAVSDDSDPNGTWYKYRTDAVTDISGTTYWVDYPGCGYDDKTYVITGNLFGLSAGGWGGVKYRIFDKTPLLTGAPAVYSDLRDGGAGSVQVAECHTVPNAIFMASLDSGTSIKLQAIRNPLTTPSLVTTTVGVASYAAPPAPPELGGGTLDALDGRIINVEFGNGKIVCGHGIDPGVGRALARWYIFNANSWPVAGSPTLNQSGNVDMGPGVHTFYPGVARQSSGEVGIICAYSSANEYAGIATAVHRTTDPNGVVGLIERVKYGSSSASGRWGDYFDACIDPSDPTKFWGIGEYPNWGTHIAEFDGVPTTPTTGILYSVRGKKLINGLWLEAGDIAHLDPITGVHTLYFDLSDIVTAGSPNLDAFARMSDGSLLLSFGGTVGVPGLTGGPAGGVVEDEDIIRFVPTSLGDVTAGSASFYFDGSDVGLTTSVEDIDALALDAAGNLWVSIEGTFGVPGINGLDEDVIQFTPTSLGATTAGTWSWILYGLDPDVKLGQTGENVDALDYDTASGTLTLSTVGNFQVPVNILGDNRDLLQFTPTALGFNPAGTWMVTLDGDLYGLSASDLDCLEILP